LPDAVLIAACAAVAAYKAEVEKEDPADLSPLFDRERQALLPLCIPRRKSPRFFARHISR
jgi:hypothetical protein